MWATLFWLLPILTLFIPDSSCKTKDILGKKYVIFEFDIDQMKFEGNLPDGVTYIPNRNIISGIEVYKGDVYVTIPRNGQPGVPVTLAKITKSNNGEVLFSPFPDWNSQTLGYCTGLQDVRSVTVDPKTDLMYIADNGKGQECEPKLVIYDLSKKAVIATHLLRSETNQKWVHSLGDIVVDKQGIVYIANSDKYGSMWIINTKDGNIYYVLHHSFRGTDFMPFVFKNNIFSSNSSVNMLALTPDSRFLFYSANDNALWQMNSDIIKQKRTRQLGEVQGVRKTGKKKYHGFSIEMGDRFLFFSNVDNKSISYWDRESDMEKQREAASVLVKENEVMVNIDPKLQYFPGKMSLDEDGYLWVVTMDLGRYFDETDNLDPRIRIVKIFVDNRPYNNPKEINSGSGRIFLSAVIVSLFCVLAAV